ncbi:2367_t:CDS:10, partial [Funneliformis geosporum]
EKVDLQQELRDAQKLADLITENETKIKQENKENKTIIRKSNNQIAKLEKKLALAEIKFNNSANNASQLSEKLEKKDQEFEKEKVSLEQQVKQVSKKSNAQTLNVDKLVERKGKLQATNIANKQKLIKQQAKTADLTQTNQQLHQEVKDLKNSTVEKKENDRLIKEQEQLKNSLDARAAEIRELTSQNKGLEKNLNDNKRLNQACRILLEKMLAKLNKMKNEKESRPETPEALPDDENLPTKRYQKEINKLVNELEQEREKSDAENLFTDLRQGESEFSQQLISEENQELQALIRAKNKRITQLEKQLEKADDNLEQQLAQKDEELEQTDKLSEEERTANAHSEDQIKRLEKENEELKNAFQKRGKDIDELNELQEEFAKKYKKLVREKSKLKSRLTERERETFGKKILAKDNKITSLGNQVKLLQNKLKNLRSKQKLSTQPEIVQQDNNSTSLSWNAFLNQPKVARALKTARNTTLLGLSLNGLATGYQQIFNSAGDQLNLNIPVNLVTGNSQNLLVLSALQNQNQFDPTSREGLENEISPVNEFILPENGLDSSQLDRSTVRKLDQSQNRELSARPNLSTERYNELLNQEKKNKNFQSQLQTRHQQMAKQIQQKRELRSELKVSNQTAEQVKTERDTYRQQAQTYATAKQIPDLSQRPDITAAEFAKYKSLEQVAEIEKAASQRGVKFTQLDLDAAVNRTDDKYQGYQSPAKAKVIEEKLIKSNSENEERIKKLGSNVADLVYQIHDAEVREEKLQTELHKLGEKNDKLAEKISELNTTSKTDQSNLKTLQTRVKNRGKKITELKEEIIKLTNRPDITETRYNELLNIEELENKQKEINELIGELNKLNDNLLDLKARDKLEITRLKVENKNYKRQRDRKKQDYQGQISRLENELLRLAKNKEEQTEKLARANEQLQQQIADNEQQKKDYQDLATELEQEQQTHTQSEQHHHQQSNQDDLVKVAIGGVMILMSVRDAKKYQTVKAKLKKETTKLKEEKQSLEEAKINLHTKIDELRKKLKAIKENQKILFKPAEQNLCRDLIKYENITDNFEIDNSLEQVLTETTNAFINTVVTAQTHLKLTDLTQIKTTHPMPEGKSLEDLITFYHANQTKTPTPTQPTITKLESGEPNETLIVNQIIQECDLGLNQNSSLTQVIERVNELIKTKPPTIKPVNQPNDTPFGEDLAVIKQLELASLTKLFGAAVDSTIQRQIQAAVNYSQNVLTGFANSKLNGDWRTNFEIEKIKENKKDEAEFIHEDQELEKAYQEVIQKIIKRGEIYWADLTEEEPRKDKIGKVRKKESQKDRPVVVISNDKQNKYSDDVIVALISSQVDKVYYFEPEIALKKKSKILADQILTMDKERLGEKITSLSMIEIIKLEKALHAVLTQKERISTNQLLEKAANEYLKKMKI